MVEGTAKTNGGLFRTVFKFFGLGRSGPGVIPSESDTDIFLYNRLQREAGNSNSNVKRIKSIEIDQLVSNLIALCFRLGNDDDGFSDNHDRDISGLLIKEALKRIDDRRGLKLTAAFKIFYIYYTSDNVQLSSEAISDAFYERIFDLALDRVRVGTELEQKAGQDVTNAVRSFIENQINQSNKVVGRPEITVSSFDDGVKNVFKNAAFICNFSVNRKNFPRGSSNFIVGKNSIYDNQEIKFAEYKRQLAMLDDTRELSLDDSGNAIYAAIVFNDRSPRNETEGISFNAHRFADRYDHRPEAEIEMFLGNHKAAFSFSAGSAEHDEIHNADWNVQGAKIDVDGLRKALGGQEWKYEIRRSVLKELLNTEDDELSGVIMGLEGKPERIDVSTYPSLDTSLSEIIKPDSVQPNIRLKARALPIDKSGQRNEMETPLTKLAAQFKPVSAIRITKNLWIILSEDRKPYKFTRMGGSWSHEELINRMEFKEEDFLYTWTAANNYNFPDLFAGFLYVEPVRLSDARKLGKNLTVNTGAGRLAIAYNNKFLDNDLLNDSVLGQSGVVALRCVEKNDRRGKFGFFPVTSTKPVNPFFAVKPAGDVIIAGDKINWPSAETWIVYDGEEDERVGIEKGQLTYNGKPVLAERSSYNLLCGTSLFEIKVSGTPFLARAVLDWDSPTVPGQPKESREANARILTTSITPDEENLVLLLQETEWAAYEPKHLDRSNISAHFELRKNNEKSLFLKAFWPTAMKNAVREGDLYEKYRDRASELFMNPPAIFRAEKGGHPIGFVFEMLKSGDSTFKDLDNVSLTEAVALGYGLSVLHRALSDDNLLNYDIDSSSICFDHSGKLCIVDFDNVFPIVERFPPPAEVLDRIGDLVKAEELPSKNNYLPPEAIVFNSCETFSEKENALTKIGSGYGVYMIGGTLIKLLRAADKDASGNLDFVPAKLGEISLDAEKYIVDDLADLLKSMVAADVSDRPQSGEVVERFGEMIKNLGAEKGLSAILEKMLGPENFAAVTLARPESEQDQFEDNGE
jgi:hypothetical protein